MGAYTNNMVKPMKLKESTQQLKAIYKIMAM